MKKVMMLTLMAMVCGLWQAQAQQTVAMNNEKNFAAFNWAATDFDFGTIKAGEPVTHEFTFTNNGTDALLISSVKASCGCTVASYTRDPIPAGQEGFVKATYNAARVGAFTKTVTVLANTKEGSVTLTIRGTVVK